MIDSELIAIIRSHRRDSLGYQDGELSVERSKALDHYHGRPYGNEMEGRSAVVSKDLSETVDWALPAIIRVFLQSGNVAEFQPIGPEDETLAQQESDVVNKVFMTDNNGFLVLHDAIKDALLLKNGYIKHLWEESEEIKHEEYTGLTVQEATILMSQFEADGAEVEVEGADERQVVIQTPQGDMPLAVFDVRLKVTRKEGKVVCLAVPPEEIRVSRRCRGDVQESPFIEHVTRVTRSRLIEMGMPRSFVDTLPAWSGDDNNTEKLARDSVTDESEDIGLSYIDRSMDEIEYCEAYVRVDWDGDGIAELRKVVTVADRIPPGDEWNEPIDAIPITGGVPKRIPHRHVGESLDDDLSDLQEIKTTLMRQMIDNIYLTNNNQWLVNERVNLTDFLQALPGGIKRVRGLEPVSGAVEPVISTPIMGQIMPAIDYIDSTKEARTGINRATTGLDPDILKQSTKGAFLENMNRASQKIEMITRMLAETLVKPALLQVHALLIKHQDKPMVARLRGQFVTVNPQEWRNRTDMRISVGLGTGSEEEKREKLGLIASAQQLVAQQGMVGPAQAYNLFADLVESLGWDMPEKYAMNPESPEFQQKMQQQASQQVPNPLAEVERIKGEIAMQKHQQELAFRQWQEQAAMERERNTEMMRLYAESQEAAAERRSRELIEAAKLEFSLLLKQAMPQPIDIGPAGIGGGLAQ